MRYLDAEWMDAARRALSADVGVKEATAEVEVTVEQVVTGGPDGTVRWRLRIDHGSVSLEELPADPDPASPPAAEPGLRFTADYGTAAAVAAGRLGAQRAFVEGRLRVGGDLSLLPRLQRPLAALNDALAEVRAATTFPEPPGGAA